MIASELEPEETFLRKKEIRQPYINNKAPLAPLAYLELPIGAIEPRGWLKEMLQRQKNGMTSQMDKLYPKVMSSRNGWLGGDGDQWERGPYWIDGLLPLAYILKDKQLIDKTTPWIEWALKSQRADGFFGPAENYDYEVGLQRNNSEDWWPRMVMLKVLKQYYSATNDRRVLSFFSKYFQYQLKTLPQSPLGHWTFWAEFRACDNLEIVYWLYNITGEPFLLELGDLIYSQAYNLTDMFITGDALKKKNSIHCVNLAQGIKMPVVYYQHHPEEKYLFAVKHAFKDIKQFHGQAQGMYGGDEAMHGNNPTQGSELCSSVEMMFSLEEMLKITGDLSYADHLEKIAFNALPTQISDDFMTRQYYQQANQVMITRAERNFDQNHGGTDLLFGLLTGYPCCTSNLHQGWPKFTNNLWYATPDFGIAAINYAPSVVNAVVNNNVEIQVTEDTFYPMNEHIRFSFEIKSKKVKSVEFPFVVRIPKWCQKAEVLLNGQILSSYSGGRTVRIERAWKSDDRVELHLPMHIESERWYENSRSIKRGPLVYALKIGEEWHEKSFIGNDTIYGKKYFEVLPTSKWNYALINPDLEHLDECFDVVVHPDKMSGDFPWNIENAPIEIVANAREVASWGVYNDMTGPIPFSVGRANQNGVMAPKEKITLIPYGCTTLRISQFPVVNE